MPHTSTGTVRLTITTAAGGNSVVFVPDHDHSVQNGETRHAVFFDENEENHRVWALDSNGSVSLKLSKKRLIHPALSAATTGTKVRISVENINDPSNPQDALNSEDASITSITLPAE